jgi:hypothetical protein
MSTRRSTRSGGRRSHRRALQHGTGLISTLAGVLVFLVLLMLATQVLFDLYARSTVTAVAYDAARVVAGAEANSGTGTRADAIGAAELQARAGLGHYADGAAFTWTVDDEVVQLNVKVQNPSLLPPVFKHALGIDTVDRTVRVRVERVR